MSDGVEGLGTAIEGGLYAKAVAERPGSATPLEKGHFAEGACLNCGTQLVGEHCHRCGQKAHLHRTTVTAQSCDGFSPAARKVGNGSVSMPLSTSTHSRKVQDSDCGGS